MLVSFSASNFRSIGEEVTLNMVGVNRFADHPEHLVRIPGTESSLVRTAVLYGANAAGKSNLVKAMKYFQARLLSQHGGMRRTAPPRFRFESRYAEAPTSLEFRFLVNDRVFVYGADFVGPSVTQEWLTVLEGVAADRNTPLFERGIDGTVEFHEKNAKRLFDKSFVSTLGFVASAPLRKSDLALSRALELPKDFCGPMLKEVLDWFETRLVILDNREETRTILSQLANSETLLEAAQEFLRRVGTGVHGLEIEETTREAKPWERDDDPRVRFRSTIPQPYVDVRPCHDNPTMVTERRLKSRHTIGGVESLLDFLDESDGTRLLLKFMPILGAAGGPSKVFVIDEIDGSLHPKVCEEFIRAFAEFGAEPRRQLIVTTHEAHLLNQDLLRRDEYWFVEKDQNQQTQLVPLSDFKLRNDRQLRKGYLAGRFGGIPMLGPDDTLRRLLSEAPSSPETPDNDE